MCVLQYRHLASLSCSFVSLWSVSDQWVSFMLLLCISLFYLWLFCGCFSALCSGYSFPRKFSCALVFSQFARSRSNPNPETFSREFCQRHYVDLAVLNTEEQYFALLNATHGNKGSFWLGLQRHSVSSWTWVNGEEMTYKHWYRRNEVGCCASLEAMLEKDEKLLARYCDELHMFVCQGE
uniref:C-type lectin domain-containing protein n=1 Tax=Echeneis naucrates TaxID=173247 RepID=A0A665WHJ3_ECHNA